MTGTLINIGAVLAGGTLGLVFKNLISEKYTKPVFQAIALFTLLVGVIMGLKTSHMLVLVFSLILGTLAGTFLGIEAVLEKLSGKLEPKAMKQNGSSFKTGLITAFLLFCMGSMTILGAIEEGTGNPPNLLLTKSVMDGFAALALASAFGVGVLFSVVPMLLYQGGLTLLFMVLKNTLPQVYIDEMTAVGGVLLLGLGLQMLDLTRIKVANMLPALLIALALVYVMLRWPMA